MFSERHRKPLPALVTTSVGVALLVLAILLTLPIAPLLISPRHSQDFTGGVAGGILILILGITGNVLVFRERTPVVVQRVFYFLFGTLAAISGIGILGWCAYRFMNNMPIIQMEPHQHVTARRFIAIALSPFALIVLGAFWIRRAFTLNKKNCNDATSVVKEV